MDMQVVRFIVQTWKITLHHWKANISVKSISWQSLNVRNRKRINNRRDQVKLNILWGQALRSNIPMIIITNLNPPARAHSNSEKQDNNNNKDDYHPYPQFAANSHGHNHTRYSKGDVGFGDLGANQNQHSVSWKGPRVFIICLQTRMIHQLCYGCYCWLWERFFS